MAAVYDDIGRGYGEHRRADPRLAAAIRDALGDARSVINVGAGAGSYEPADREVLAIEPSAVMIAQRAPGAAPALQAVAESLPAGDGAFDAALAVLTVQHWSDVGRGLAELRRVTRHRVVVVTIDVGKLAELWLIRDYLPEMLASHAAQFPSIRSLVRALPGAAAPRRPRGTSSRRRSSTVRSAGCGGTSTAAWDERHGRLRRLGELDVGLRIVCWDAVESLASSDAPEGGKT